MGRPPETPRSPQTGYAPSGRWLRTNETGASQLRETEQSTTCLPGQDRSRVCLAHAPWTRVAILVGRSRTSNPSPGSTQAVGDNWVACGSQRYSQGPLLLGQSSEAWPMVLCPLGSVHRLMLRRLRAQDACRGAVWPPGSVGGRGEVLPGLSCMVRRWGRAQPGTGGGVGGGVALSSARPVPVVTGPLS